MSDIQEHLRKAGEALRAGLIDEAEAMFNALLNGSEGLDAENMGRALSGRGLLLCQQGHFDAAVEDLRKAEALLTTAHGAKAPITVAATLFLAQALLARGDVVAGGLLAHDALDAMDAPLPDDDPFIAEACFMVSQAEYELNRLDAAEALTRQAMAIWGNIEGPESVSVSTCLNNLGRIYEEREMLDQGIAFHQQALTMRRNLLGEHEETAFSMGNLGTALAMNNQWEEAAKMLEECVACYARVGITDGVKVEGYKQNLEICRKALGVA